MGETVSLRLRLKRRIWVLYINGYKPFIQYIWIDIINHEKLKVLCIIIAYIKSLFEISEINTKSFYKDDGVMRHVAQDTSLRHAVYNAHRPL